MVAPVSDKSFQADVLQSKDPVMVDFWAEWCGPCRAVAPVLEEIAEASDGDVTLMKVNVDENSALAARYEIRSIPTILFFKDGEIVDRVVGAASRAALEKIVDAQTS